MSKWLTLAHLLMRRDMFSFVKSVRAASLLPNQIKRSRPEDRADLENRQ